MAKTYEELCECAAADAEIERLEARVAKLEELVEEWQAAAGIGVDSDGITPAMAEAHWGKLEKQKEELEARPLTVTVGILARVEPHDGEELRITANIEDKDRLWKFLEGCPDIVRAAEYIPIEWKSGPLDREESKPEAENQPEREEREPCRNCGRRDCEPGSLD